MTSFHKDSADSDGEHSGGQKHGKFSRNYGQKKKSLPKTSGRFLWQL